MKKRASNPSAQILELRLWNFRAFRWAFLPLSDLTVLVGPNGAGKSTIAQALSVMSQALTEGLETALAQSDGALSLISRPRDSSQSHLGLAIKLRCGGIDWLYGFLLKFRGENDYFIDEERLTPLDEKQTGVLAAGQMRPAVGFTRDFRGHIKPVSGKEVGEQLLQQPLAAATAPYLALPLIAGRWEVWEEILRALRAMRTYQLIPEQIRVPHSAGSTSAPLARDGNNAADVFQSISGSSSRGWIVDHLAHTTNGVEDVQVQTVLSMRSISIVQRINGSLVEFGGHALSEGTMRMFGALLALRQEPRPSLVFLDEADADLHPPVLDVLLSAIESCLDHTQVVIASHSTEALSHESITADRVRMLGAEAGTSHIYPLHDAVKRLLKRPESVGRLLSINALEPSNVPYQLQGKGDLERRHNFLEVT